jgi:hypothetical protein
VKVDMMTYARVAHDAAPGGFVVRPHDSGVDAFLFEHVGSLRERARTGDSPVASFVDPEAAQLFQQLLVGTEEHFLAAARTLTLRLIGRMDRRAAPGLLVCLRLLDGRSRSAAALKLEVVTPHAAVLESLDSGEEVLAAATNVLDAPGDLQKGGLVPDPRPSSDVVIGDRLAIDAQYFPTAFGIQIEQRALDATFDLVSTVQAQAPSLVRQVVQRLPDAKPGSAKAVLEQISSAIPELNDGVRSTILDQLEQRKRPVRTVDTRAPLRLTLSADGITVSGPAELRHRKVEVLRVPEGGWRISVALEDEPTVNYRR